jgi:hypothetical protein
VLIRVKYITSNLPHHPARRGAIYLVRSLSDKYDRLPASIILTEVHYDPRIAVAQSESANVHKGTYKKEDVAVKKIRFGLITNAEKRKKAVAVRVNPFQPRSITHAFELRLTIVKS